MGPNAKIAAYHGGGSASLAAYYAVTPFDGISAQLTSPPDFISGCYAHKELPVLSLKTDKGEAGFTFKSYNEPPSVKDRVPVDDFLLNNTELLMMDYHSPNFKSFLWFADIEGMLTSSDEKLGRIPKACGAPSLIFHGVDSHCLGIWSLYCTSG